MRIDVFLKLSRLVPRRTLAQEFCDKGLVTINGAAAKSSKEVKTGDSISIRRRDTTTTVKVLAVPAKKQLSKAEAEMIFEIIDSTANTEGDLLSRSPTGR